jgi:hypothetical protein
MIWRQVRLKLLPIAIATICTLGIVSCFIATANAVTIKVKLENGRQHAVDVTRASRVSLEYLMSYAIAFPDRISPEDLSTLRDALGQNSYGESRNRLAVQAGSVSAQAVKRQHSALPLPVAHSLPNSFEANESNVGRAEQPGSPRKRFRGEDDLSGDSHQAATKNHGLVLHSQEFRPSTDCPAAAGGTSDLPSAGSSAPDMERASSRTTEEPTAEVNKSSLESVEVHFEWVQEHPELSAAADVETSSEEESQSAEEEPSDLDIESQSNSEEQSHSSSDDESLANSEDVDESQFPSDLSDDLKRWARSILLFAEEDGDRGCVEFTLAQITLEASIYNIRQAFAFADAVSSSLSHINRNHFNAYYIGRFILSIRHIGLLTFEEERVLSEYERQFLQTLRDLEHRPMIGGLAALRRKVRTRALNGLDAPVYERANSFTDDLPYLEFIRNCFQLRDQRRFGDEARAIDETFTRLSPTMRHYWDSLTCLRRILSIRHQFRDGLTPLRETDLLSLESAFVEAVRDVNQVTEMAALNQEATAIRDEARGLAMTAKHARTLDLCTAEAQPQIAALLTVRDRCLQETEECVLSEGSANGRLEKETIRLQTELLQARAKLFEGKVVLYKSAIAAEAEFRRRLVNASRSDRIMSTNVVRLLLHRWNTSWLSGEPEFLFSQQGFAPNARKFANKTQYYFEYVQNFIGKNDQTMIDLLDAWVELQIQVEAVQKKRAAVEKALV